MIDVFGIGNPLIDIIAQVHDADLDALSLDKGIMHLVDLETRSKILRHIEGKEITYRAGGSCPNTLVFLSALGVECALSGKIGSDEFGSIYLKNLPSECMHSHIKTGREPTGSSIILVTPDSERTMNTYLGANREFSRDDLDESAVTSARFLYFTGYMWDTGPQKDAVLHAIELVKSAGGKVAFDVADPFAVNRNQSDFQKLIADSADIVFANAEEGKLLFGSTSAEEAAEAISSLCGIAVVKDGSKGSVVKHAGGPVIRIPVRKIRAVDTTGAGDMYAAGFLYGLIGGFSERDAGICGSYLASRIVETFGAQFTPDKRAVVAGEIRRGKWKFI